MRTKHGIEVRGLTRKEIKELKPNGFFLGFYNPPVGDLEKMDEGIERVLDLCVLDKEKFEDLENENYFKTLQVFRAICAETYGAQDEEKNLPTSGDGTQTEKE